MTETLVTAATILVPLLLLIPLLGKYIDIKHASIQAARYEAWEYTVWYGDNSELPGGFVDGGGTTLAQPVKSPATIQKESRWRFFSDPSDEILPTYNSNWGKGDHNPLWDDHRGNSLVESDNDADPPRSQEPTPDYSLGILNTLLDILDAVFEAMAWAMDLADRDVGFTMINTDGRAESNVVMPVTAPVGLIDFPTLRDTAGVDDSTAALNIDYTAEAAVLTDGWNAGGLGHSINQTGGLVPTKILNELIEAIPGLSEAWDVVSLLVPEWRRCNPSIPHFLDRNYGTVAKWNNSTKEYDTYADGELSNNGSLWLGYMNIDAVHPDRLDVDGGTHNCPDGICSFDPPAVFADCEI